MRKRIGGCLIVSLLGVGATSAAAQTAVESSGGSHPMIDELRAKGLQIPVAGVAPYQLKDSFRHPRGEKRVHNAVDIPAPRGTPVLSADWGRVLKLLNSKTGGLTVYAADPTDRYVYYYAHLDRYHPKLHEGMVVAPGDTIGYVGTTGNAPKNSPHLHFTILRSLNPNNWSRGTPVNPAKVF